MWNLKYKGIGDFEGHFSISSALGKIVSECTYLIVTQGEKQALITGREIIGNEIIFYGKTLTYLLGKRVVKSLDGVINADEPQVVGDILKVLIKQAFSDTENFIVENSECVSETVTGFEMKVPATLYALVKALLDLSGAGVKLTADFKNKKWILKFYRGNELEQVVSEGNKNAYDVSFSQNIDSYASDGYFKKKYKFMGIWNADLNDPYLEDSDPDNYGKMYFVLVGGNRFGIDFKQGYLVLSDSPDGKLRQANEEMEYWCLVKGNEEKGILRWEKLISAECDEEAEQVLAQDNNTKDIALKIKNLFWGKDYNLGDSFVVKYEKSGLKFTKKATVSSVMFYDDAYEKCERPCFEISSD